MEFIDRDQPVVEGRCAELVEGEAEGRVVQTSTGRRAESASPPRHCLRDAGLVGAGGLQSSIAASPANQ